LKADGYNSKTAGLVLTSIKTANYVASPSEIVRIDLTTANVAITLPATPSEGDLVGLSIVRKASGNNIGSLNLNGNSLNGGSVTAFLNLTAAGDSFILRYDGSDCGWTVESVGFSGEDDPASLSFSAGGIHSFTIPARALSMTLKLWGAGGQATQYSTGASEGGPGGYTTATFDLNSGEIVTNGQRVYAVVGNCGGIGKPGAGALKGVLAGGYSGIFTSDTQSQATSVAIAGGGGGSGNDYYNPSSHGHGGNSTNSGGSTEADPMQGEDYSGSTSYNGGEGGGGYEGGTSGIQNVQGLGGTGFAHADASSSSIEGSESGNTPPQTGDTDYVSGVGEGGDTGTHPASTTGVGLGTEGLVVVNFTYS